MRFLVSKQVHEVKLYSVVEHISDWNILKVIFTGQAKRTAYNTNRSHGVYAEWGFWEILIDFRFIENCGCGSYCIFRSKKGGMIEERTTQHKGKRNFPHHRCEKKP